MYKVICQTSYSINIVKILIAAFKMSRFFFITHVKVDKTIFQFKMKLYAL